MKMLEAGMLGYWTSRAKFPKERKVKKDCTELLINFWNSRRLSEAFLSR
jgi:hypothetical protein